MSKKTLLCVDDEQQILKSLERGLRKEDFALFTTTSAQEALKIIQQQKVDVVISDYRMEEMTGLELLKQIRILSPKTIRIILSGYADEALIKEALKDGNVHQFLLKPWDIESLKKNIRDYFEQCGE